VTHPAQLKSTTQTTPAQHLLTASTTNLASMAGAMLNVQKNITVILQETSAHLAIQAA
jgi:hypothetical protein